MGLVWGALGVLGMLAFVVWLGCRTLGGDATAGGGWHLLRLLVWPVAPGASRAPVRTLLRGNRVRLGTRRCIDEQGLLCRGGARIRKRRFGHLMRSFTAAAAAAAAARRLRGGRCSGSRTVLMTPAARGRPARPGLLRPRSETGRPAPVVPAPDWLMIFGAQGGCRLQAPAASTHIATTVVAVRSPSIQHGRAQCLSGRDAAIALLPMARVSRSEQPWRGHPAGVDGLSPEAAS